VTALEQGAVGALLREIKKGDLFEGSLIWQRRGKARVIPFKTKPGSQEGSKEFLLLGQEKTPKRRLARKKGVFGRACRDVTS